MTMNSKDDFLVVIMRNKNKQKLETRTELYYTVSYKLIRGINKYVKAK
jgi:hypothetical protein